MTEDSPLGTLVHNDLKVENILFRFVTTSRGRQIQARPGFLDAGIAIPLIRLMKGGTMNI